VALDAHPAWGLSRFRLPSQSAVTLAAAAPATAAPGRQALLVFPEPNAVEVYYSAKGRDSIFGWALENTPHHPLLRRVLDSARTAPAYLSRLFQQWDVRQIAVRGAPPELEAADRALQSAGFLPSGRTGEYSLYESPSGGSPVRALAPQRMLVVGRQPMPLLATYPSAQEASPTSLRELDSIDVHEYPVLGLAGFETSLSDLQADEVLLEAYLRSGGTVVADMSGMEDLFGRTLDFLGVNVIRLALVEEIPLRWDPTLTGLPTSLPLIGVAPEGWSGAAYEGLDHVLGDVQYQGEWWPILGYKQVGAGRIWFLGMNLLYYSQISGQAEIPDALREATLAEAAWDREPSLEPLPITSWNADGTHLTFVANSGSRATEALVSYTYSPRWRATVDGEPQGFGEYEHLIRIQLPPGEHTVAFEYRPFGTPWPVLGLAVGALGGAALAMGLELERRSHRLRLAGRAQGPASPVEVEYAPCPNCGFRLAEVGPPTSITYPFQVVRCPICGMKMDDEGFAPGENLDPDAKARALASWLRSHDYEPGIVHDKWGFGVSAFFSPPPLEPGEKPPATEG
jgi:hypothetical protein